MFKKPLEIVFPNQVDLPRAAIKTPFYVVGHVLKNLPDPAGTGNKLAVKEVRVELKPLFNGGPAAATTVAKSKPLNNAYSRWFVRLSPDMTAVAKQGRAMLVVTVFGAADNTTPIDLITQPVWLRAPTFAAPTIAYPDDSNGTNPYLIEDDERDCLICSGSGSLPTILTLDGSNALDKDQFDTSSWWGMFAPGTVPGPNEGSGTPYVLRAENPDGSDTRLVYVANS